MATPTIQSYGANLNASSNRMVVKTDWLHMYFSYNTLVAFCVQPDGDMVVRCNSWGPTTGRHLNLIPTDGSDRLSSRDFEEAFKAATTGQRSLL